MQLNNFDAPTNFQLLFESAPGLYLILLPNFTITAVSDSYLKATMTKREDIIGRGLFDVFPDNPADPLADGVSNLRASLENVLKNKTSHTMAVQKYDIRRQDGTFEERFWSPLNKAVLNEKGDVIYIIHRVEDVTEYIRLKNEGDRKDVITEKLLERVGEMEVEIFKRAKEIQKLNAELELKVAERTLELNLSEKNVRKLNEELESRIEQRTRELEIANREMEMFSYSVSHDLRAPLRAIGSYANMLEEDYGKVLDKEGNRLLNVIKNRAKRMGQLIDDLLTFSKLGKKEIQKTNIDMNDLVQNVLQEISSSVDHNARVKTGELLPIRADHSLMNQVLVNLISNAVKYSSRANDPMVEIESEEKNGEIIYSVKDSGVGFDMKYADKLFGVFQRLHTEKEFEGTGVGLAIVKRIVNKHGGNVWTKAKVDEGATFYFSIPVH